nr:Rv3235 family protein [Arcanobacterium phocae]
MSSVLHTSAVSYESPRFTTVNTTTRPALSPVLSDDQHLSHQLPISSPEEPYDRLSIFVQTQQPIDYDDDDRFALDRPLPADIVPATTFSARIVGQAIEVLHGHRPVRQLQSWLASGVYRALVCRAGLNQRLHGPAPQTSRPAIRRVHVNHPRRRIAEVSVVVHDGFRIRAVALRLEIHRDHWIVTALEIA